MNITTLIIIALIIIAIFILISIYNQLVRLKAQFKNAFAQIEVQLKRRYDLIPNLVETAKAYLKHESETLIKVTEARNQAISALKNASADPTNGQNIQALNRAEQNLNRNMSGLNLQLEAYPDLKASTNMMQLSEEITSTENRVSYARQAYNDAVTSYNIALKTFPAVLIAPLVGHTEKGKLLEFEDSAQIQSAPKVNFN
ncbi:Magnetosome formation protein MamQ [Commensalibacter communis]|uniref:Lipoprotein antigen LemA family (LemA) n=1 Tax=Commensalibacter communis TaxID=2972786 RepID=A0A9W4TMQ8_9PROT|nr:LemA family protein [Commensalibacter communis]CAI3926268.1 Magnetosome formation protein MamQ [Commensalibacter communis]CAI3926963.1 Magnetosome formation protein MamQ [Commensalibacter communis]CAI3928500.1 Magnetosome formation protein MamQ [Commensalibacter communis]CAI3934022.1 Magnetosome formation protein MamQ [Commensalibacter communis]CAI3934528.1 Magnetosome formation protein MamQ [Commensalibacter communis]